MKTEAALRSRTFELHVTASHPGQFLDLTERVAALVAETGVDTGFVNVQVLHTTAALALNENEPLLLADLSGLLESIAPSTTPYAHDDLSRRTVNLQPGEPANGHAHAKALLLRASETLNVVRGELALGRWQRLFLLELDSPRPRRVSIVVLGR